jgi:hypothetical protein
LASALNDRLGTTLPDLKEKPANRKIGTRSFLNEAPVFWCSWFALQCPCRNAQCQALYRRTSLPPSALLAQSDVLARRQTVAANAATVGFSSGGFAAARNLAQPKDGRPAWEMREWVTSTRKRITRSEAQEPVFLNAA